MRHVTGHFDRRRLAATARVALSARAGARSAFTLVELIATLILLGIVFTTSISMLAAAARQRRGIEQRQFAIQHAANLLERTMAQPWSKTLAGDQTLDPPSDDVQAVLPGLKRRVEVKDLPRDNESKLISVTVRWKDLSGHELAPVHLSAWMYPTEQPSP